MRLILQIHQYCSSLFSLFLFLSPSPPPLPHPPVPFSPPLSPPHPSPPSPPSPQALESDHCGSLECLLNSGGDANKPDKHGSRPLHLAAYHGNIAATTLLLERGAVLEELDGVRTVIAVLRLNSVHSMLLEAVW